MIAALIILASLAAVGGLLYLHHRQTAPAASREELETRKMVVMADDPACCGTHLVCDKRAVPSPEKEQNLYYDDEELDAYRGRGADSYDEAEIEQFRDVLLTLSEGEVADWGRSIQSRGIELPAPVRDELLILLAEAGQNIGK